MIVLQFQGIFPSDSTAEAEERARELRAFPLLISSLCCISAHNKINLSPLNRRDKYRVLPIVGQRCAKDNAEGCGVAFEHACCRSYDKE